jgi:hypothetical protein
MGVINMRDTMHTEARSTNVASNIASLLGLRDSKGDLQTEAKPRATAEDHRIAHSWGVAIVRGRVKGRTEGQMARKQRRVQNADVRAQTKKATRRHRRGIINGLQNESTVLGLARVYVDGAGNESMQRNVAAHVQALSLALAKQQHPEFWTEDVLSPEDHQRQIDAALVEAEALINDRMQEVLDRG